MHTGRLDLRSVDQVSIAVKDIGKVIESWSSMLGIGPWSYRESTGKDAEGRAWKTRIAYACLGPVEVELIQPLEGNSPQAGFIARHGEGLHHLGFLVDDLEAEFAALMAQGARALAHGPGNYAYMETGGPGGLLFELMSREWWAHRRRSLVKSWESTGSSMSSSQSA